eukprot:TRINITY_DN2055_c1_g2_i1.p5 TRINITY_DN2055_c1_g2~~TRINITY_DN2055_c1_g2_i1.p5  ORF type:complete len:103 (-),score=4.61 TRINITY_DN2055_c1_g2_i1:48-356(-)
MFQEFEGKQEFEKPFREIVNKNLSTNFIEKTVEDCSDYSETRKESMEELLVANALIALGIKVGEGDYVVSRSEEYMRKLSRRGKRHQVHKDGSSNSTQRVER